MTVTIEIPARLEAELEAEARRRGLSKEEFVQSVLEEKLSAGKAASADELPFRPRILARDLPVKDRSREHEWLRQHRDEYDGQWVALDGDRLIASGEDLKKVAETARRLGAPDALMVRVEPRDALPYVGDLV
ncbi:MAG: DUF5678 domain-containing protein [Acidobacteriota bacterium]